jgi:hypothetical protein
MDNLQFMVLQLKYGAHISGRSHTHSVVAFETSTNSPAIENAIRLNFEFLEDVGGSRFLQNIGNHLQGYIV